MGAYDPSDKRVTDATTPLTKLKRLFSFGGSKDARERKRGGEPKKPRTVRHVHVGSGNSRKMRKSRGSKTFTWKIETMMLEENTPTFVDLSTNTIYVNESHPLYRRRLKDKNTLRNYILREVAREIAHAVHRDDEKKAVEAYGRLLNRIEEMNRIVTRGIRGDSGDRRCYGGTVAKGGEDSSYSRIYAFYRLR